VRIDVLPVEWTKFGDKNSFLPNKNPELWHFEERLKGQKQPKECKLQLMAI
jgi:hypothetical protein